MAAEVVLQGFPPQGLAQVIPQMLAPEAAASRLNLGENWAQKSDFGSIIRCSFVFEFESVTKDGWNFSCFNSTVFDSIYVL